VIRETVSLLCEPDGSKRERRCKWSAGKLFGEFRGSVGSIRVGICPVVPLRGSGHEAQAET
jgi:hypothetical protein